MAKMQQQTEKFVTNNENQLLEDEKQELLEEKQQLDACGIGAKYQCIVCRSRHNQDEMGLMACCQQSSLLYHLVDDTCKAFENENSVNRLNRLKQLNENDGNTRIGSNFTFCGHAVHWSCFDTYMTQVHAKDAGDQYHFGSSTIRLSHHEFVCPYCKTISNILIPLQYVHRNSFLESSDIGTLIKDVKLSNMLKSDFFDSQLSIFDSSCFKLWSMDAINVILLNSLTKTHANMITDFFQRFNNIEYYLNESENDSKLYEINNIRKANTSKDVRQLKLAVKLSQSLHYSISSLEVKYRCHSKQERKDRLARSVALFNTLVSSVWSLFALYSIQQHSKQLHAMNSFSKLSMTENDVSMENDGNNNDNVSGSNLSASAQGSMDYSLLDKRSPSPNPPSFSMSGSNISNENMSNISANSRAQQLRHSFQTGLKGLKRIGNMGKTWISNKVANRGKSNLPLLLDEKGMILLEQSSFGYLQKRFGYNQENSGFNDKPIVAKEDSKANNNSNVHGTKKLSNFMSLASKTKSDDINETDEKEMSLDNEKNSFGRTYDAFEIFVRCVLLHPNMLTIVVRQSGVQTETPLTPNKVQSFAMNAVSGGLNKTPIFMPLPQTAASQSNDNDNNSNNKNNKNNNNDESIEKQALNRSTSSVSSSSATSLTPTLLPMSLDHGAAQNEQAQLNGKSLSELYHILLSCFTMKFTQISVQYVMFSMGMTNNRNVRNPQMYEKYDLTDWFEIIRKECLLLSNNDNNNNNEENIKIKQNALYYVIVRILPFLRKCCLLLNTFGLVEKGIIENTLWTSIPDNATTDENISMICVKTSENALNKNEQNKNKKNNDNDTSIETGNKASNVNFHFEYDCDMVKVLNETNKLCQVLQLPKINDCLKLFASLAAKSGENGINENGNNENENEDDGLMLNTIHGWICNYLSTMIRSTIKHENEELKYLFNNSVLKPLTNTIKLPKLAILPQHFDPLFQTAYEMHCDNKPKTVPEDSAICLLCGKFLCINCCRYDASNNGEIVTSRHRNESLKGSLTLHAKQCGFGKCVFLWLQRSDVILIYEHAAAVFNSPYLDGYGEEDSGLRRGGLLYLNHTRLNKLTQLVSDQMINNKVCQLRSRGKHYLRNWF